MSQEKLELVPAKVLKIVGWPTVGLMFLYWFIPYPFDFQIIVGLTLVAYSLLFVNIYRTRKYLGQVVYKEFVRSRKKQNKLLLMGIAIGLLVVAILVVTLFYFDFSGRTFDDYEQVWILALLVMSVFRNVYDIGAGNKYYITNQYIITGSFEQLIVDLKAVTIEQVDNQKEKLVLESRSSGKSIQLIPEEFDLFKEEILSKIQSNYGE